jgi:iron-sulfur cluster repair protein YtfE (RIC family)
MPATLVHSALVVQEHHERIRRNVDRMPDIADVMDRGRFDEFRAMVHETSRFLTEQLIPHMDAAEGALFPELERMMQNRHSTRPLRQEHDEIRADVTEFVRLAAIVERGPLAIRDQRALRRVLFRLYGLVKVHLAEELLYADIVEHGKSPEAEEALAAAMEHIGHNN